MTEVCSACGSELSGRDYWNIGSVKITWFGGDEAFGTKACMEGSVISYRGWPKVCRSCMTKVVDALEGRS